LAGIRLNVASGEISRYTWLMEEPGPPPQNDRVRVLVVDDHDLFRTGLASLLAAHQDIEVVGQESRGRMAIRLSRELRPDVVLMDLRMPDLDGVEATREIVDENPDAKVLVLTVSVEEADVAGAVVAGACGYLVKDAPIDDVVLAIRAAVRGDAWLSPRAAAGLLDRLRRDHVDPAPEPSRGEHLSPRELGVLQLLAKGMENAEIAAELGISARTAKNHVSRILTKLGVQNRIQAAVYAVQRGLD
jgi:DNA-binding NarL/FixJ family response regulator